MILITLLLFEFENLQNFINFFLQTHLAMESAMRNVEIKARVKDIKRLESVINEMKLSEPQTIHQHDIYFNSRTGRLKLRKIGDSDGELIFYERTDTEGPKLSSYNKMNVSSEEFENLTRILRRSLGSIGEVRKLRKVYMYDQTRIHLDQVNGMGDGSPGYFVELEVVLEPDQSTEAGQRIAESIMKQLGIDTTDLISCSYIDLMLNRQNV